MISSLVMKDKNLNIEFIKVEVDLSTGKMRMFISEYEINGPEKEHVLNKHRVYLPCKINIDPSAPLVATLCVPIFWDDEAIENYVQAMMDELFLYNKRISGCKHSITDIEKSFMLEMILL